MFFSFINLVLSTKFGESVVHLTELPPNNGHPYMVMFHSPGCVHCQRLAPTWSSTAELGDGVATFAELDCSINASACKAMQINSLPTILYFLNGQVIPYKGMQISRLFVNFASSFLNDTWIPVDASNFTAPEKAAILFSDKQPKVWNAVQNALNMSDVQFYISQDKTLLEKLGLSDFPAAYIKIGDKYIKYESKIVTRDTVKFMKEHFEKTQEL